MNQGFGEYLTSQTIFDGVPNFVPILAGIWVVAYFTFVKGKR